MRTADAVPLADTLRRPLKEPSGAAPPPHTAPAGLPGFLAIRPIAAALGARVSWLRPQPEARTYAYGPVPSEDSNDAAREAGGAARPPTYFEDAPGLKHGRSRRRRWAVCGMVCGLSTAGVALVLALSLLVSRAIYGGGSGGGGGDGDDGFDAIFADWRPGSTGADGAPWYPAGFLRDVVPIPCHSHNDYWRKVPLFSALRAGCIGTEADVWLVDGDLLVGHKRRQLTPGRTFQSLYVDPLVEILARANANDSAPAVPDAAGSAGRAPRGVFDTRPGQTLALLVDVKTRDGGATLRKVLEQVEPLRQRGWLTTFADGRVTPGPVTLVASGAAPFDVVVENATRRDLFFDAPLERLTGADPAAGRAYDATTAYYASVSLRRGVGTPWLGAFGDAQLRTLRDQLQQAHARGLKARYWGLPAWPASVRDQVWRTLVHEGVDLLNVDDLQAAARVDYAQPSRQHGSMGR